MNVKIKIVRSILFILEKKEALVIEQMEGEKKRGGVRQKFKREGNLL
jgi:hypothetical protein